MLQGCVVIFLDSCHLIFGFFMEDTWAGEDKGKAEGFFKDST